MSRPLRGSYVSDPTRSTTLALGEMVDRRREIVVAAHRVSRWYATRMPLIDDVSQMPAVS
jgi:hypothetical protein